MRLEGVLGDVVDSVPAAAACRRARAGLPSALARCRGAFFEDRLVKALPVFYTADAPRPDRG